MSSKSRRGFSAVAVAVVLVAGLAVGVRLLWTAAQKAVKPHGCTFSGSTSLDLDQSNIASTMVSVVIKRNLPERAAVLVVGAALQESKLRNLTYGDHDSVGVLQQRPSQGWGTAGQLTDVRYATGKFLDALVRLPHWQTMDFAEAIQAVQISADTSAYAKHADNAQNVADALWGVSAAGVTCHFDAPTIAAEARVVAAHLNEELPVAQPTVNGKQIVVPNAGWQTVGWLVAHADQYGIAAVRFDGQEWTRNKGWHEKSGVSNDSVQAEMATIK